jgi:hypothetical protein
MVVEYVPEAPLPVTVASATATFVLDGLATWMNTAVPEAVPEAAVTVPETVKEPVPLTIGGDTLTVTWSPCATAVRGATDNSNTARETIETDARKRLIRRAHSHSVYLAYRECRCLPLEKPMTQELAVWAGITRSLDSVSARRRLNLACQSHSLTGSRPGLSSVYGFIVIFSLLMAGIGAAIAIMDSQATVWNAQDRARQIQSNQRDERLTLSLNGTSLIVGNVGLVPSQLLYLYQKNGATSSDRRIDSYLQEGANLTLPVLADMTSFAVITSLGNVFWVSDSTQPPVQPATISITFDASGLDQSYGSAIILSVDSSPYALSSLPKTFEWAPGSTHSYSYVRSFSTGSGSRAGWSSARGLSTTMSGMLAADQAGIVVSTYSQQYFLNVTGGDTILYVGSPSGDGWYNAGSFGQFTSSYSWSTTGGSRQNLYAYSLDEGSPVAVARSGSGTYTSPGLTMAAPHTVAIAAVTQKQLVVSGGSGIGYSLTSQTNDGWYDSGLALAVSSKYVWNQIAGQSRQDLLSFTLDGTTTSVSRADIGNYTSPTITMNVAHTLTFNSTTQYYLSVSGGTGTATVGSQTNDGWFDSGSSAQAQSGYAWGVVAGQSRSDLYSYSVDSSQATTVAQAGSGTYTTYPITMNSYHALTFNAITQYFLAVNGGSSLLFAGSQTSDGWYNDGTTIASVTTNYGWSVISGQSRQNLLSWNLDGGVSTMVPRSGSGTFTTQPFTMDTHHTLNLNGQTQYALNAVGGSGVTFSGSQTGDGWYDSGGAGTATTNYVWGVVVGQSRLGLVSWNLDGGANQVVPRAGSGTYTTASVTMNTFHTINFNSLAQYRLTVQSVVPTSGSVVALLTSATWISAQQSVPVDSCFQNGLSDWEQWFNYGGVTIVSSPVEAPCSYAAFGGGGIDEYVSVPSNAASVTLSAWIDNTGGGLISGTLCGVPNSLNPTILGNSGPGYSFVTATSYYVSGGGSCSGPPQPAIVFAWSCSAACRDDGNTAAGYVDNIRLFYSVPQSGSTQSTANTYTLSGSTVTYSYGIGYGFPSGSTSTSWSTAWPSGESYSSSTCSGAIVSGSTISGSTSAACSLTTTYSGSYSQTLGASPTGDGWYDSGTTLSISASASGPFSFSSWSAPAGITVSLPSSASTTALVNAYGAISCSFNINQ